MFVCLCAVSGGVKVGDLSQNDSPRDEMPNPSREQKNILERSSNVA